MMSGFLDVSTAPKTKLVYLWRHQGTLQIQEETNRFRTYYFVNLKTVEIEEYDLFGEDRHQKCMTIRLKFPCNLEYGIMIFQKT